MERPFNGKIQASTKSFVIGFLGVKDVTKHEI